MEMQLRWVSKLSTKKKERDKEIKIKERDKDKTYLGRTGSKNKALKG